MTIRYEKADESNSWWWWCDSHKRKATHFCVKEDGSKDRVCDPKLGGILLPCLIERRIMSVLEHEKPTPTDTWYSITRFGGALDGEKFTQVKCQMSDGTTRILWVSNTRTGYFKQVFVPWDFEHSAIV